MNKFANIRSALFLTVAALTVTTFIATSSADAAEVRGQSNVQISVDTRKAVPPPTQNVATGLKNRKKDAMDYLIILMLPGMIAFYLLQRQLRQVGCH